MHGLETIVHLNTEAAIKGVSRRAKAGRKTAPIDQTAWEAIHDEELADKALAGDQTAWEAMVAVLAEREAA